MERRAHALDGPCGSECAKHDDWVGVRSGRGGVEKEVTGFGGNRKRMLNAA